ncbi:vacuolar protein sorting-associated protein 37B-like protein [Sarcoptes scabiei]|uniref:Vacuolar protein sorting-associated protein 37B-like protein n=1 Tax=Sarcoptes scabiei TaxID=52283 RepID=A0A132A1R2_SARSC|nr:vacuolar protein sorting-associated protein 37B-like protein [Sarcoptes scabiei]
MSYFATNNLDISGFNAFSKTDEELKQILDDTSNEVIDSFIKDMAQIKSLERERDKLIEQNKEIAERNLSFETTYRASRQELMKALEECQSLKNDMNKTKSKIKEFNRQNSLDTTLALMQAAMAEAEENSDEVANSFLKKEISIEEFLREFHEKRKLFHARRIKTEKMPAEINRIQALPQPWRMGPTPSSLPFSNLSINSNDNNPNPPYPTNPYGPYFSYPTNYH